MSGSPSKTFEDLIVWQKAHQFVLSAYKLSRHFPTEERYGLTSQLRRAAVSIPANIAEGFKKTGKTDKLRFYNIAQGSLEECRYYLRLAADLEYGENPQLKAALVEVSRMLDAYMASLRRSIVGRTAGLVAVVAAPLYWLLTTGF